MPTIKVDTSPIVKLAQNMREVAEYTIALTRAHSAIQKKIPYFDGHSKTWKCPVCNAYHASWEHFHHYNHCPLLKADQAQQNIVKALSKAIPAQETPRDP